MRKIILSLIFSFGIYTILNAQTLPTPIFIEVPCHGVPGGYLDTIVRVDFVPGATYYEWQTIAGQENTFLINGYLSPVQTLLPNVSLSFAMLQNPWEVCVTAYSSCCSSATACTTIYSLDSILFDQANSLSALPNSSGNYTLNYLNCIETSSSIIYWSLTGDITFINGQQTQLTPFNYTIAQLNFGPGFTTGTLCAYSVNSINLPSNTICMTINSSVGINENENNLFSYFTDIQNESLNITIPSFSKSTQVSLYNMEGKFLSQHVVQDEKMKIDIGDLENGVYLITVKDNQNYKSEKFILCR